MRGFLLVAAALFLAGAMFFAQHVVSDIQLIIVVVMTVGGVVCLGLASVLKAVEEQARGNAGDQQRR